MKQTIIGSLCWVVDRNHVLMLKRNKFPHQGYWGALGGKVEIGESPLECVIREVREESGLLIENPALRGIVSVYHQRVAQHWILFVYMAKEPKGTLGTTSEGELKWLPLPIADELPIAKTDRVYLKAAMKSNCIFQAKITYDDDVLFDITLTESSEVRQI